MDPNATRDARREALMRARQHNLDDASIAKETVRMVLEQAFLVSYVGFDSHIKLTSRTYLPFHAINRTSHPSQLV
jgi:hypothetical protein